MPRSKLTVTVDPAPVVPISSPPAIVIAPAASVAAPLSVLKVDAPPPIPVASRLIVLGPFVMTTVAPVEVRLAHAGEAPPPIRSWPLVPLVRCSVTVSLAPDVVSTLEPTTLILLRD